ARQGAQEPGAHRRGPRDPSGDPAGQRAGGLLRPLQPRPHCEHVQEVGDQPRLDAARVCPRGGADPLGLARGRGARGPEPRRLAVTGDDVGRRDLPSLEVEAKRGDSRYRWFVERYGGRFWEVDALSPVVLRERVRGAIAAHIDADEWERLERRDAAERADLFA